MQAADFRAARDAADAPPGRIPFDGLRALLDQWRAPRPTAAGSGADKAVAVKTSELITILTEMQVEFRSGRQGPIAAQEIRARVEGAIRGPGSGRRGRHRVLGEIDADTLDLVLPLFEYIVQGGNLPDPIMALVGRLQIPLVKAALLDKRFFQDGEHPVRRLLNRIADATLGWADDEDRGPDSLYGRIEQLVGRIVREFDRDLSLIDRLDADLAAYLAEEAARVGAAEAGVCAAAARRDCMEGARRRARAVIDERLRQASRAPDLVESLLTQGWLEVLAAAYLDSGEGSPQWGAAVGVVDRLIWSVQPKVGSDERRELLRSIPDLLRTLRMGLTSAVDQRLLARWFRELHALHLAALGGAPQAQQRRAPVAVRASQAAVRPHVRAVAAESSPEMQRIEPGAWIELVRDDARRLRVKLVWVSGDGQQMQFVDRQGREGPHMARDDLATLVQYGLATVVHGEGDAPLVDRAISTLVRTLGH